MPYVAVKYATTLLVFRGNLLTGFVSKRFFLFASEKIFFRQEFFLSFVCKHKFYSILFKKSEKEDP